MATVLGVVCIEPRVGCTKPIAENYDVSYNVDSGECAIKGCTDSTKLNYVPEANFDVTKGLPGYCIDVVFGCMQLSATNYDSGANLERADSCIYAPPSPTPAPPEVGTVVLGLGSSYTIAELETIDLQASVQAFLATVPPEQPDYASFSRRRLDVNAVESTVGWIADADWRVEFARRVARIYWLPRVAVSFKSAAPTATGTQMLFDISASYLPSGATVDGLKSYADTLPSSVYSSALAIPITSVSNTIEQPEADSPPPAPPSPPPDTTTTVVSGLAPGVVVAIVLPIVVILLIGGGGFYWYQLRKKKRMPMATVLPDERPVVNNQLLVQPPDLPD